ncbi:MAG: cytidine deaminase [Oscillospiraceae bacterium]|nr:cytidine deaminase [Oscillospiraceae bacterium]
MELGKDKIRELIERAFQAREKAYVPYSNFLVGAALLTTDGKIHTGCNIESVSYTPTTCAERTAILKSVSEGDRNIAAIAVCGGHRDETEGPQVAGYAGPCGVCRQLIYEFGKDITVIIAKSLDEYYVHSISELYPLGFGPEFLID